MSNKGNEFLKADEVKRHNTRKSVWMVIRNDVYDVTAFVNEHPGGEDPLLEAAGQDATIAFEDVGHSEDARKMLTKYKIGTLAPGEGCCKMKAQIWRPSSQYHRECTECDASSRNLPFKSDYKPPASPRVERRVQHIVVPRESSRLKWALLALAAAIIVGLAYKKYNSA